MSGPGKIHVFFRGPENLIALLYNFDVDSTELKQEHALWLATTIPFYYSTRMEGTVLGLASRTGPNSHNMGLSLARANRVEGKIWLLNPRGAQMSTVARVGGGEEVAKMMGGEDKVEDQRWRGVLLIVQDAKLPVRVPYVRPPVMMEKRVKIGDILTESTVGIPQEPEARRAEASRVLLQTHMDSDPHFVETRPFDTTWEVASVSVRKKLNFVGVGWKNVKVVGHQTEFLLIDYTYQPPGGEKCWLLVEGVKKRQITQDEAGDWVDHPRKTFRRHIGL